MVDMEFHGPSASQRALKDFAALPGLPYKFCSPELADPSHHLKPDSPTAGATQPSTLNPGAVAGAIADDMQPGVQQAAPFSTLAPDATAINNGGRGGGSSIGAPRAQFPPQQGGQPLFQDPSLGVPLGQRQQAVVANLVRVRALVAAQRDRIRQQRTNDFLSAASKGNCERLKLVRV